MGQKFSKRRHKPRKIKGSASYAMMKCIVQTKDSITIPSGKYNIQESCTSLKSSVVKEETPQEIKYTLSMIDATYRKYLEEERPEVSFVPKEMIPTVLRFIVRARECAEFSRAINEYKTPADRDMWQKFKEYSELNPIDHQICLPEQSLAMHNISVLNVCYRLIEYYRTRPKLVNELYRLIALSHMIMGVTPEDFWFFKEAWGNFAVQNGLVNDTNIEEVSVGLYVINENITKFMKTYKAALASAKGGDVETLGRNEYARDHYRLMKEWRKFVNVIRLETLASYAVHNQDAVSTVSPVPTIILKHQDFIMKHFCKKRPQPDQPSTL